MNMARYVLCSTKCDLQHKTLAIAWSLQLLQSRNRQTKPAVQLYPIFNPLNPRCFMKQNFKKAGRHPKIDATAFRCSVNFTASEHSSLQTMHEQSGIESLSAFVKMRIFGKPFKVFVIDENTREFIDRLSSLNARYRTFAIDYDLVVKSLRENFNEKKAMKALYKLEQITIEMVKVNREIVALAKEFDARWSQKSL